MHMYINYMVCYLPIACGIFSITHKKDHIKSKRHKLAAGSGIKVKKWRKKKPREDGRLKFNILEWRALIIIGTKNWVRRC